MKRRYDETVVLTKEEAEVIENILALWDETSPDLNNYTDLMDEAVDFWVFINA